MRCLLVEIFQCYQLNFATLLCLKKSIRESAFRENIIMIVVAFSKYRCVIPHQIEFIHTNFFISVLARTDDIALTLDRCSNNINLYLLFFSLGLSPTTDRFRSVQWGDCLNNKADNPDTSSQKSDPCNPGGTVLAACG